jgi:hypothetical protein
MERVKDKALELLRAAVEAANANGAPASPFKGLNIPLHRFGSEAADRWPVLEASLGDDDGRGVNKSVPEFDVTADLYLDGVIAAGRDEAGDLDLKASLLVQAICDTLLESREWLGLSSYIARMRRQRADAVAKNSHGEFDAVCFTITLTLAFREGYAPPPVVAVDTTIAVTGDIGPAPTGDDPDARHLMRQQFETEGDS